MTLFSCHNSKTNFRDYEKFEKFPNTIFISCTKCDCIIEDLNKIYDKSPNLLKPFTIYGDSKCLKNLKAPHQYFSQDSLDRISLHFYNMLIIKKNGSKVVVNQVETLKSSKISELLKF